MIGTGPTVFVFERTPYWTPELQRQFADKNVHVRQCNSLADVRQLALPTQPPFYLYPRVVLLDFPSGPAGCLQFLVESRVGRFGVPVVVYAVGAAELEWPLREAGATEVVVEHVPGHEMARLCQRLLQRSQPTG